MRTFRVAIQLFALIVSACSSTLPPDRTVSGIDGEVCVGTLSTTVDGRLAPISNPTLLKRALGGTGRGGVCTGRVFSVAAPITIYRVYDSSNPYSKLGSWWTMTPPAGERETYRSLNAICPEWSALNRLVACEVRPGSEIVLGVTQSAQCADGSVYPKRATVQVFIPNDGAAGIIHVGNCREEGEWPKSPEGE